LVAREAAARGRAINPETRETSVADSEATRQFVEGTGGRLATSKSSSYADAVLAIEGRNNQYLARYMLAGDLACVLSAWELGVTPDDAAKALIRALLDFLPRAEALGRQGAMGDIVLQRQDLAIIVVTTLIMALLWLFFGHTLFGKALRATSQNARAAALIGIPVGSMRMAVWGLASAIAGIAGVLLAPKLLMTPDMGAVVMLAFAAAIIGGFSSLPGCVVGGIALGVIQNLVGIFISPQAIAVTPFFVIMLVLLVRPEGLFGESVGLKKV